jgi:hypothetical protein
MFILCWKRGFRVFGVVGLKKVCWLWRNFVEADDVMMKKIPPGGCSNGFIY